MIWGAGSVTGANLNKAKASGKVLLAFNEPDFGEQMIVTGTDAASTALVTSAPPVAKV